MPHRQVHVGTGDFKSPNLHLSLAARPGATKGSKPLGQHLPRKKTRSWSFGRLSNCTENRFHSSRQAFAEANGAQCPIIRKFPDTFSIPGAAARILDFQYRLISGTW